jgi:hypothetical protein
MKAIARMEVQPMDTLHRGVTCVASVTAFRHLLKRAADGTAEAPPRAWSGSVGYHFPSQPSQMNRLATGTGEQYPYPPSKAALGENWRCFGFLAVELARSRARKRVRHPEGTAAGYRRFISCVGWRALSPQPLTHPAYDPGPAPRRQGLLLPIWAFLPMPKAVPTLRGRRLLGRHSRTVLNNRRALAVGMPGT